MVWVGHDELQLPMDMQVGFLNKMDAGAFRTRIDQAEHDLDDDQPLFVFDNHDNARSWNRYGDGKHNLDIARVIATLLLATRSTAIMYCGEELGMTTTTPARVEDVKDPIGKTGWPKEKGRDGERTPMQWDGAPNAGFTTASGTPWLPVPPSYKTVNVAIESREDDSLLAWYQSLIQLRRENPALHDGSLTMLNVNDKNVLSWLRKTEDGQSVLVACNFTAQTQTVAFDPSTGGQLKTLLVTPGNPEPDSSASVKLPPYGVYIGQVQ
jgi:alpha-glucosidase